MNSAIPLLVTALAVAGANPSPGDWATRTNILGLVVILAVIGAPVYILLLTSIFGRPRGVKVVGLLIGSLLLVAALVVLSVLIGSAVLDLIVPG